MSDSELAVVATQTFQAPSLIERADAPTKKRFFEFFTVPIRNANTRSAYYRAIQQFLDWVERAGYQQLEDIEPITVAAYIETLQRQAAPPTIKQHMAYTFARIGAAVNLKVEDYYPFAKRFLLRFREKGGKEKELPMHHKLEELLDQYLKETGLEKEPESPLFPAAIGKTGKLSRRPLVRTAWAAAIPGPDNIDNVNVNVWSLRCPILLPQHQCFCRRNRSGNIVNLYSGLFRKLFDFAPHPPPAFPLIGVPGKRDALTAHHA
jgi:integrase